MSLLFYVGKRRSDLTSWWGRDGLKTFAAAKVRLFFDICKSFCINNVKRAIRLPWKRRKRPDDIRGNCQYCHFCHYIFYYQPENTSKRPPRHSPVTSPSERTPSNGLSEPVKSMGETGIQCRGNRRRGGMIVHKCTMRGKGIRKSGLSLLTVILTSIEHLRNN